MVDDDVLYRFRLRLFAWPRSSATCARRAASSGSTTRPTTAGGVRSCARASRCSGPGSAGHPGCPTRRASWSSSASSPSRSASRGSVRGASAPASPRSAGAASSSVPTASGGSSGAMACPAHQPAVARRRLCRTTRTRADGAPGRAPCRGRPPGRARGLRLLHVVPAGTAARRRYTAIDLASSFVWAELATTPLNPSAARTSALAKRVAADLRSHGWRLERVLTDNGSEFRSSVFGTAIRDLGAAQTFIRPGRPTTNGAVERVQRTILEECWRPSFARSLVPKLDGPGPGPRGYLDFYNTERAHTGRLTAGRTPFQALVGARKMRPR